MKSEADLNTYLPIIPRQSISLFFLILAHMGSLLFFVSVSLLYLALVSCISFTEFVYPNLTASNFGFVDASGTFLLSRNGTFKASMCNPGTQQIRFYLCVIHVESNSIIWSANRDAPISNRGFMGLTSSGITISEQDGSFRWSTPRLSSPVSALHLSESGNLVLLDHFNGSLWESFRYPADTIVIGQHLPVNAFLSSGVSSDDLATGDYTLTLATSDATLQWQGLTYWKLSMDTKAYTKSNYAVEYMMINQSGLYLFGNNGSLVVIQVDLPPSNFRVAKLDSSGQFIIISFSEAGPKQDFVRPIDKCRIPYICGKLGLCANGISLDSPVCSCPPSFQISSINTTDCIPTDISHSLPISCELVSNNSHFNSSGVYYIQLGYGMDYFANDFIVPARYGVDLAACQGMCLNDCSCLGVFYENSSGSCYTLAKELGSIMLTTVGNSGRIGFIKTLVGAPPTDFDSDDNYDDDDVGFPIVAAVLLPLSGLFLLFAVAVCFWRRHRLARARKGKSSSFTPLFSGDLEFCIPGVPLTFYHEELVAATQNFTTQIGKGGFGAVYKGVLPDKTHVAVKKITDLGVRGKKDFYTEIAIIGNIRHVNLVKLIGYSASRGQWLLVYEYMNRGSLDKSLFGDGPVLQWQDRVKIAIGAAHGLAYLHCGCEQKIIHCDVKPENILLQNDFQAKLSDFGLSKLLSPEQSSLFTTMRGTRGYLAPEWLTSSTISDKTDVYSFGMVLLEIVSGRKNCLLRSEKHGTIENSFGGPSLPSSTKELDYFPLYALDMHEQGEYSELADPMLEGRMSSEEVVKFVRVALCCVHEEPWLRPNMVSVVGMLKGDIPVSEPRIESLNYLRFYGRRFARVSESGGTQKDVILHRQANISHASAASMSYAYSPSVSSEQISGQR